MTRKDRSVSRYTYCNHAASYLRDAALAFDLAAKARSSRARRRAKVEAKNHAIMFLFWLSKIGGKPSNVLSMIGKAMEGKLRLRRIRYDDKIETAYTNAYHLKYGHGLNLVSRFDGSLMLNPISIKEFKDEYNKLPSPKPKLPADSSLRRTLKRRGHDVSGKPGAPKKLPRS